MKRSLTWHSLLAASSLLTGGLSVLAFAPVRGGAQQAATVAPPAIPAGGTTVLPTDTLAAFQPTGKAEAMKDLDLQKVSVTGQPFKEAYLLTIRKQPVLTYDMQIRTVTTAPVKKGDVLLAAFSVRNIKSLTGEAVSQFVFERNGEPYTKSSEFPVNAGAQWKVNYIPFVAAEDYAAGEAVVNLRLGYPPQTLEIGGISVVNYGSKADINTLPRTHFDYQGREPNASWRKAAQQRIEKLRKGDLTVRVQDAQGNPVAGASVTVAMKRHAFGFGSAVAASRLLADDPDSRKYQQIVASQFSRVVLENDLKWQGWEEDRQRALNAIQWLRDRNIEVRGHNLVWPSWGFSPDRLKALKDQPDALREAVRAHIADEVSATKGTLVEWDVVNEPVVNHDIMDILGQNVLVDWYKQVHALDPKPALFLNEYSIYEGGGTDVPHQDAFEKYLRFLKDKGAPLGGIGIQSHFGWNVTAPTKVLEILDRYAKFELPIEATEFDININDDALQADYTRDFLTALFSHPAVNGIVMWGFWQNQHWLPDAALYRADWSLKPNGKAWQDLVLHQWWTNAAGTTNPQGQFTTRGFLGDYDLTAMANGKSITVPATLVHQGSRVTLTLK